MNKNCDHDWEDITSVEDKQRQLICTYCDERKTESLEIPFGADFTDGESYYSHIYHDKYEEWINGEWVECEYVPTGLVAVKR